jgi:hypothetical protein
MNHVHVASSRNLGGTRTTDSVDLAGEDPRLDGIPA